MANTYNNQDENMADQDTSQVEDMEQTDTDINEEQGERGGASDTVFDEDIMDENE